MQGITLKINRTELNRALDGIMDRMTDSTKAMRVAGAIIRESIRTNFARGGRPASWAKLKRRQGQPLRDTNRLMNSITSVPSKNSVRVGTNVVYAGVHQFGAAKGEFGTHTVQVGPHYRMSVKGNRFGVRGHARKVTLPWGTIPARPFAMTQKEDVEEIRAVLAKHITKGE